MAYIPKPESVPKYYAVVSQLLVGVPLKTALINAHLGHETFERVNDYQAANAQGVFDASKRLVKKIPQYKAIAGEPARRVGVKYRVDAPTFHLLTRSGLDIRSVPLDARNASLVGTYWNEVDNALRGKTAGLQQFQSIVISDIHGNRYHLLTDVNAIRAWLDSMTDAEQREFWRTLYLKGVMNAAA